MERPLLLFAPALFGMVLSGCFGDELHCGGQSEVGFRLTDGDWMMCASRELSEVHFVFERGGDLAWSEVWFTTNSSTVRVALNGDPSSGARLVKDGNWSAGALSSSNVRPSDRLRFCTEGDPEMPVHLWYKATPMTSYSPSQLHTVRAC